MIRSRLIVAAACSAIAVGSFVVAIPYLPSANADSRRDTETVPRVIAYTGTLERDGNAVSVMVPMRFALSTAGGTQIWAEERSALPTRSCSGLADCGVAVHSGTFSVMLGQYTALTATVLDAEDVYLSIAVHDGTDWVSLNGRQRITPTPYALWSLSGTDMSVGGDLSVAQTLDVDGTVDVLGAATLRGGATINGATTINNGLTTNGTATFNNDVNVNGSATLSSLTVSGIATTLGQLRADGGIRMRGAVTMETADLLFANIPGRGDGRALVAQSGDQLVVNFANDFTGGTRVESAMTVTGAVTTNSTMNVGGQLTANAGIMYTQQTNDSTSQVALLPRYHMRLTFPGVGNATRPIPTDVLDNLCGDTDGCRMRISMRYWSGAAETAAASRDFLFFYDIGSGRWRTSTDAVAVSGDGSLGHAYNLYNQCFLTDTTYSGGSQGVDTDRRMHLLLWNVYSGGTRECNLTIED